MAARPAVTRWALWALLRHLDYWLGALWLLLLLWAALSGAAPSLSVVEALWLWVASTGLRFGTQNLLEALVDQAYNRVNGRFQAVADSTVRREQVRLVQQGALLAVGVYAATPVEWRPGITWVPAALLIVVGLCSAANSYLDARMRRTVARIRAVDADLARMRALLDRADELQPRAAPVAGEHAP